MYVLLNNGTGWNTSPDPRWTFATSTLWTSTSSPTTYIDRGIRFMDINGDGLPDLVRAYKNTTGCSGEAADVKGVWLNTGSGWATSTAYTLPAYIVSCNASAGSLQNNEYVNFNGNGQFPQDVLSKVLNVKGGTTNVGYQQSASKSLNPGAAVSLLVAATTTTNDNNGTYATTSYTYTGGAWYTASGVRDRQFAGFSKVVATNPDSIVTSYFSQAALPFLNRPIRKDIADLSSNLKQSTLYRWDTAAHADSTFVGLGRQITEDYASDGTHRDKDTDFTYSSTTDDLLQTTQYGEVTANTDGSVNFTDVSGDTRTTKLSYAASSSANMSVPIEKTLFDTNSATSSDQKLYYDSLPFGQVAAGNTTKQEDWISGTTYASSTNTYNSYGLVATSTDRNSNATSYVYDRYNLFPATTTNALLQQTQAYYNYANGKAKQTTDPNNRLAKTLFDGVGRVTEIDQSSTTTPTTYATSTTYVYTDSTTSPSLVHRADYLTAANTVDTFDYYDGLNRLIQDRKNSQTSNIYAVTDTVYNQAGEVASTSLPYFSSGSANTSKTSTSALYTNSTYDALQRLTLLSNAVGTASTSYSKWTKTTTDPNGNTKDYTTDAFGNLASVVEYVPAAQTTSYTYDTLNDLATTTDARSNVRGFTYDGLGRRLTAQDLHYSTDTTFGIWNYTYDPQGNLTSQTDPKSQVVNRTYDALNRLTTEDYTGNSGTEVTLTYDSCTNGIGSICIASSTDAKTTNAYDILGRTTSATTTSKNLSYNMSYAYDRQGNITGLTYPSGSQVNVSYNLAGLPSRIQRKPSGGSWSDIITNYDYAPQGQLLNALFGNNASTTYFYDASAMYRLSNLQTNSNNIAIQKFAYTYDHNGNITQIANTASSTAAATTAYLYDALNRLLSGSTLAASSSPYTQTFSYDALGNLLSLGYSATTSTVANGTAPSILDTLPTTMTSCGLCNSLSLSYTVPSGGSNKLLVLLISGSADIKTGYAATLNGVSLSPLTKISTGSGTIGLSYYAYLANPTSGTFNISWSNMHGAEFALVTLQDANVSSPVDVTASKETDSSTSTVVSNITTTADNDLLLGQILGDNSPTSITGGSGQTDITTAAHGGTGEWLSTYKTAGAAGVATLSGTYNVNTTAAQLELLAMKFSNGSGTTTNNIYSYAGTGYANPDAVTQIANGLSTTTFTYDNNGNVTQKTVDGTTTTYVWDYANRLIALGVGGATTTYGYDAFGQRVFQVGTSTTTLYPFKWYSVASSTGTGAKYATTTEYVFNGDPLVSTTDQQTASGAATGTAQTRYIHPDHLGSTNVLTNASGTVVQTLDYYPYGATRISTNTGGADSARKYIGQFADQSNLDYLNARYYDGARGQFTSEDPVFWGDPKQQNLIDPQSLNTYSYSVDNPITKKDPSGRCIYDGCAVEAVATLGFVGGIGYQAFQDYSTGDFSRRSIGQNIATYLTAGGTGAVVAGGTAIAGVETAGLSLLARLGAVALTSGTLTAGTEVGGNAILGQPINGGLVLTDSIVSGLGSGVLEFLPGVPGALPQSMRSALSVFSKAHAARSGAEAFFGTSLQIFGSTGYQFANSNGWSWSGGATSKSSTGASSGSSKSAQPSSAVGAPSVSTWMGSFNPFSPHSTMHSI
jgi:RHS repeat-associated protein